MSLENNSGTLPEDVVDRCDPEAVIAVDWEAVEENTGQEYPEEVHRIVEREGSANEVVLDRWGYADYAETAFSAAIWEHGRLILPDRGAVPKRYVSLRGCDVTSALRVELYDADLNYGNLVDGVDDDISFVEGFGDLVDVAATIAPPTSTGCTIFADSATGC